MTAIPTARFYERSRQTMGELRARAERLQQQVASGERLARSSDDPLAAARLRSLARAEALAGADRTKAERAEADLGLADDALSDVASLLIRARELATQAANGTLSSEQRGAIGTELEQLHAALFALANSRDSMGHALFGGETAGQAYALSGSTVTYIGTANAGELDLGQGQSVTRGVTGPEFLTFGATDLFATLSGLAAALQGASTDPAGAARGALATLDAGLDTVTTAQAVVGARLARIDMVAERRELGGELCAAEQAEIGGTDLTTAVSELQQALTVLEASQASFARLSSLSLFDMLR